MVVVVVVMMVEVVVEAVVEEVVGEAVVGLEGMEEVVQEQEAFGFP